jgi:hypothetical protein
MEILVRERWTFNTRLRHQLFSLRGFLPYYFTWIKKMYEEKENNGSQFKI